VVTVQVPPRRRPLELKAIGRYSLASRYDLLGQRRQFACRATRISPYQMRVDAPVLGPDGERVVTHFNEFGKLDGWISEIVAGGFVLDLAVTRDQRAKLATQLDWLEKRQHDPTVLDARKQQRVKPADPHTTILLADGTAQTCFVIDVSPSGVAVSADLDVEIGTRLAVGRTVGQVVRRFDEGFAVRFDELQDTDRLEKIIQPTTALVQAASMPRAAPARWYVD